MIGILLFVVLLSLFNNKIYAEIQQDTTSGIVKLNAPFTYKMLEANQNLRKVQILIEQRQIGVLQNNSLIIGASLISIADYQRTNTESKFGYLMRHPTSNNQIGKEVSEAVIHSFQVAFSGAVNSWLAAHAEILYNPEQSFGQGTITALERNEIQLRKGFILIGDLNNFPVYAALGKMDAPFGKTGSVNPFSNSTMWHAFGGLGYGFQVSFMKWNIHATFMAVQGGAQFRALNTMVSDSGSVPSKLNNYTADLNYNLKFGKNSNLLIGGSYIRGSAYCQDFPIVHFKSAAVDNPAATIYGILNILDRLIIQGAFATTLEVWPGTHNPNPPLDVYEASKVSSIDAGIKYGINKNGIIKYTVSGAFSNFMAGPDGAPWERQNQIILGFSGMVNNSSKIFIEFFRTDGYAPLNFISGGNLAPGETHSVRDAFSHGFVFGGMLTF